MANIPDNNILYSPANLHLSTVYSHPWRTPIGQSILDKWLYWGLLLVTFSLPIEGITSEFIIGGRTLSFLIMVPIFMIGMLRIPQVYQCLSKAKGLQLVFAAFFISFTLYYYQPLMVHSEITLLLQLFAMTVLLLYPAQRQQMREWFIWSYWFGWAILVFATIYALVTHSQAIVQMNLRDVEGASRATDVFRYSSNYHVSVISVGIIISISTITKQKNFFILSAMFGILFMSSIALLISNSKGGTLSLFFVLGIWIPVEMLFINRKARRSPVRLIVMLLIGMIGIYLIMTYSSIGQQLWGSYTKRVTTLFYDNNYSSRDKLTEQGLKIAAAHPFGVGQANSMILLKDMNYGNPIDVHNYYVRMLIDSGWQGFLLFMIGLIIIVKQGYQYYRQTGESAFFWSLIYLLFTAALGQTFHFKQIWFFIAMNAIIPLELLNTTIVSTTSKRLSNFK